MKIISIYLLFLFIACSAAYEKYNKQYDYDIISLQKDTCFVLNTDTLLLVLKVNPFSLKANKDVYFNTKARQVITEKGYETYWLIELKLDRENKIFKINDNSYMADESIIYGIIKGINNRQEEVHIVKNTNKTTENHIDGESDEDQVIVRGFNEGYNDGQRDGSFTNQSTWLVAGCGGGFFLGCIGAGGVWLMANSSGDHPAYIPKSNSEYSGGYLEGYILATKSKRASAALMGGVCGMVITAGIIFFVLISSE